MFILLLAGMTVWLWRRSRRPALTLLGITLLLYLSMTGLVSDRLIGRLERAYEQPATVKGDVIVILGAGATSGTPDLNGEGNLLGPAANRLLTGLRLHRLTGLPILFSGGQVFKDSGNEADIAVRQLQALGVPADQTLAENRSLNTEQNAVYTAEQLNEHGWRHPILVTSAFHMARAMTEFRNAGLDPLAFPTDYTVSRETRFQAGKLVPSPNDMSKTGIAIKEYAGWLAAKLH
ncbi:Uncharacterized SAM-binding protein YcdF, DUF218 family [Paenibacillus sp. NFR01]|nr:Uncharacterized SAM-binding protein YcdF, DUF218 family [Paenibacillus sp. NFR01]